MSMEANLHALLKTLCPRVHQVVAPNVEVRPYVTWQCVGGRSLRAVDNAPLSQRNTMTQINVWADKPGDAKALSEAIEEALCASAAFTAEPQGEALAAHDPQTNRFGSLQRFSIYADRT
jgi:hypothetical protein